MIDRDQIKNVPNQKGQKCGQTYTWNKGEKPMQVYAVNQNG